MSRRALAVLALVLALAAPAAAPAAAPPDDVQAARYTAVERQVMCVTCKIPLQVAESPQALAQKREIKRLVAQGLSTDQVLDRLVATYGSNVLAVPQTDEGIGLAAYVIPVLVVALLVGILLALLPRWRRRRPQPVFGTGAAGGGLSGDDERRLDAELRAFDR
jgi:cytochrome c-type biogenesis protein CcmH